MTTLNAVEQFKQLFRGRENVHGTMWYVDGEKKVNTVREAAPESAWEEHIAGTGKFLGQVPIRLDNSCYFAAIDIDDEKIDHHELEEQCGKAKIPATVCRSKSGGAHLYFFFMEPVAAETVVRVLKQYVNILRLSNPDGRGVEIFPKQKQMKEEQVGNWINLPYWGGDATNRWAMVDGQKLTFSEFVAVAHSRRLTRAEFEATVLGDDVFAQGPPCLSILHKQGIGAGERNVSLYNIGIYFKLRYGDDFPEHLADYNQEFIDPPVSGGELDTIITSLKRDDFKYKCNEPPISLVCRKGACMKRKFGIKHWATEERKAEIADKMPSFGQLVHIMTDPAKFILTVQGQRVPLSAGEIMDFRVIREKCMGLGAGMLPRLKPDEWDEILEELYETRLSLDAPATASVLGQFKATVFDFLDQAEGVDDSAHLERTLIGAPVIYKRRVHFRSQDLDLFLKKQGLRLFGIENIYASLHVSFDGDVSELKVAGQDVWSVPWTPREALSAKEADGPGY